MHVHVNQYVNIKESNMIFFYPSWPKSSVNFCNLTKSSSLTVGLDVASERSMSFCKIIKKYLFLKSCLLLECYY